MAAARDAYNNLTESQQALVMNYQTLLTAEKTLADIAAAAEIDALIQTLTEDSTDEEIEAAREAFETLTPEQHVLVIELLTLEDYERQVEPNSILGSLLIILIVIAGISPVNYFGFYNRGREEG